MQKIIHPDGYKYLHPIFEEFEQLYYALSHLDEDKKTLMSQLFAPRFSQDLKCFEDTCNRYGNFERYLNYTPKEYHKLDRIQYPKKNIIIAFSGGKDSTATALHYKNLGFNVYLYHVHGLNRFYPSEQQAAEKVASYLGCPLIIENAKLSGTSLYPDHPLKNIIIANMMLQWGITNGVGVRLAFGDYYTASLSDVHFETDGDDCREMWIMYRSIVKKYIPGFKLETPLTNVMTTLKLLEQDRTLLELTQSCVMTYRFKAQRRELTQKRFNIKLMPNRCGCCWKCAIEYMYYADHNVIDYDRDYYIYCIEILAHTLYKESGYLIYTISFVWDYYMLYPMTKSKCYEEIKDAIIRSGKIKFTNKIIED